MRFGLKSPFQPYRVSSSYFLAGKANVCYKIENEVIVVFQTKIQDKASSEISLVYVCKIFFCPIVHLSSNVVHLTILN